MLTLDSLRPVSNKTEDKYGRQIEWKDIPRIDLVPDMVEQKLF